MIRHVPLNTCLSWFGPTRSVLLAVAVASAGFAAAAPQPPVVGSTQGPAAGDTPALETRCGWLSNPSPGNVSLEDRDGEWLISQQGLFEAKGDWPDFPPAKWVSSGNASYGYGCACLKVRANAGQRRILEIASASVKPLSACRRDKRLKTPASH